MSLGVDREDILKFIIKTHAVTDPLCIFSYQIAKDKFKNTMRVSICMVFLHPKIETIDNWSVEP